MAASALGRPSAKAREQLQARILRSAARAFLDRGFDAVSMDEIAQAAKTSKQTIYARFPTKTALFAAVLAWRFERVAVPRLTGAEVEALPPEEYLQQLGMILLRSNVDPEIRKLSEMLRVALQHSPEMAETFWNNGPGRGRAALRAYLLKQVSLGVLAIPDIEIGMEQFLGLLIGGAVFRISRGMPPLPQQTRNVPRYVSGCVSLFLSFYRTR